MKHLFRVLLYAYLGFLLIGIVAVLIIEPIIAQPYQDISFDLNTLLGWFRGIQPGVYIMIGALFLIHLVQLWDALRLDATNKRQNQLFEVVVNDLEAASKEREQLWDRLMDSEEDK